MTKTIPVHVWEGCYDKGLKGFITNESFSHPAKYSLGLIERIFDYCLERGYLRKNDVVGDCFGGVAIGGLVAAYRGLRWCGVELEPKFVGLCRANIQLHRSKLEYMGLTLPEIIQGDSRKFHAHVQAAGIVSSPPYADSIDRPSGIDPEKVKKPGGPNGNTFMDTYGQTPGQIGRLKAGEVDGVISSPPYADTAVEKSSSGVDMEKNWRTYRASGGGSSFEAYKATQEKHSAGYGKTPGQIAALKSSDVSAVISSPPYGTREDGGGIAFTGDTSGSNGGKQLGRSCQAVISSPPYAVIYAGAGGLNTKPAKHAGQQSGRKASAASQDTDQRYGQTDGQIAALKSGDVSAVVTSPPWENNSEGGLKASKIKFAPTEGKGHYGSPEARAAQLQRDEQKTYGDSPGQIGKEKAETYWEAMKAVYESCFLAIKPGGYIVLVVKDYVKGGKRVPLCDDTCRLLEHVGFQMVERIHAMLVKETKHDDLFEANGTTKTTSRKSFFRRLAEKNGSPKIDFEEVLIARKPL